MLFDGFMANLLFHFNVLNKSYKYYFKDDYKLDLFWVYFITFYHFFYALCFLLLIF